MAHRFSALCLLFLITPRVLTFLKEPVQTHYKISIKDQSAAISKIKVGKKNAELFLMDISLSFLNSSEMPFNTNVIS